MNPNNGNNPFRNNNYQALNRNHPNNPNNFLWHIPQGQPLNQPQAPQQLQAPQQPQAPRLMMEDVVNEMIQKLRNAAIQNPNYTRATVRYGAEAVQQGQNNEEVRENAVVRVEQEGQINGQNVQSNGTARIRVRRDLF